MGIVGLTFFVETLCLKYVCQQCCISNGNKERKAKRKRKWSNDQDLWIILFLRRGLLQLLSPLSPPIRICLCRRFCISVKIAIRSIYPPFVQTPTMKNKFCHGKNWGMGCNTPLPPSRKGKGVATRNINLFFILCFCRNSNYIPKKLEH